MPTFQVATEDGRNFEINADRQPTNEEASQIISQQNNEAPAGFENPFSGQETTQAPSSDKITGLNAVGTELTRGLGTGTGQAIADIGWLANAGGLFKNGVGNAINQYGKDMIENSINLPETSITGLPKGILNFAGSTAPMLATFAGGELMGAAKIGELATEAVGALTNLRTAKYFGATTRAVGQATLFGVVNAIDTAATLPEHASMKEKINAVMDSGKTGLLFGAIGTPLIEMGSSVLSKYGEKAAKSYASFIMGDEKAGESAINLFREPGTYNSIVKVDPTKPIGSNIELKLVKAKDITKSEVATLHEKLDRDMQLNVRDVKLQHDELARKLDDSKTASTQKFNEERRQIDHELSLDMTDKKLSREQILTADNDKLAKDVATSLQHGQTGNSQLLQQDQVGFESLIKAKLDLMNNAKNASYNAVIKNAPGEGYSARGLMKRAIDKIKNDYKVQIVKEEVIPIGTNPRMLDQMREQGAKFPTKWTAKSLTSDGVINPQATKVTKYLTDHFLPDLEEKAVNNGDIYTLDMLRGSNANVKALGYEDGISNPGFATLDRVTRPNVNIDLFTGSEASRIKLIEAAEYDAKFYNIKSSSEKYISDVASSVESKAKAFGRDINTKGILSELEAHMELAPGDPNRLSSSMDRYYKTNEKLISQNDSAIAQLKSRLQIQKGELGKELESVKFVRGEEKIGAANRERNTFLDTRRDAIDSKRLELEKYNNIKEELDKAIQKQKFDRENALNEIATIGNAKTVPGRIQRGLVTVAGMAPFYGHAITPGALLGAAMLSPRGGVNAARWLLRASKSGTAKSLESLGKSSMAKKAILGGLLRSGKYQSRQKK